MVFFQKTPAKLVIRRAQGSENGPHWEEGRLCAAREVNNRKLELVDLDLWQHALVVLSESELIGDAPTQSETRKTRSQLRCH